MLKAAFITPKLETKIVWIGAYYGMCAGFFVVIFKEKPRHHKEFKTLLNKDLIIGCIHSEEFKSLYGLEVPEELAEADDVTKVIKIELTAPFDTDDTLLLMNENCYF